MKMNMQTKFLVYAMAWTICVPSLLFAVDTRFNQVGPADFNDPANWDTGALPGPDDNTFIGDFGTTFVTPQTATITGDLTNPVIGDLRIGQGVEGVGTLDHSAGSLTTAAEKWSFVGVDGTPGSPAQGTYNLSGTASFFGGIGVRGVEDFTDPDNPEFSCPPVTGGCEQTVIGGFGGPGAGNVGTLNISDNATFEANRMFLGNFDAGSGTINQSGGTVYIDSWLSIGRIQSQGTYNMSGGSLEVSNDFLTVGENDGATGIMTISGSSTVQAPSLAVGRFGVDGPGATGNLTIQGSNASINADGLFLVGVDDLAGLVPNDSMATVTFEADAAGVSPITVAGDVHLNDGVLTPTGVGFADLVVDLTAYASTSDVTLVDAASTSTIFGEFRNATEGMVIPGTGGRTITYMGGPDANDIMLVGLAMELLGDYDDSGQVGAGDLGLVLQAWGTNNYGDDWVNQIPPGTNVGAGELSPVLGNWGGTAAPPAVPEPAGLGIVALVALLGFARRRR